MESLGVHHLRLWDFAHWCDGRRVFQERFNLWFLLHSVVKLLGGWVHLLRAMWTNCVVTCLMTMYGIELRFTQLDVGRDLGGGRRGHPR